MAIMKQVLTVAVNRLSEQQYDEKMTKTLFNRTTSMGMLYNVDAG